MSTDLHHDEERRGHWEQAYVRTRRNLWLRRRRIARLVDAAKDGPFLEMGCGDGLNLGVARELGYRELLGMDVSLDLVRRSEVRPVLVGDGHRLPFASGSLQTIFVDSVLHHLTDYAAAAAELARVLCPGGRLYYFEPRPGLLRSLLDRVTMSGLLSFLPFLAARRQSLLEEWDLYRHWLRHHGEMAERLEETGMRRRYLRRGPIGLFAGFEWPSSTGES